MPSITTWTRLEPRARTHQLDIALQARVHDPLWLLARQWQMGELRGEDAGSAARVELEAGWAPLSSFRPGGPGNAGVDLPPGVPLEALVEREDGPDPATDPAAAAETGLNFVRQLELRGLHAVAAAVRDRFRLAPERAAGAEGTAARTLSVLAGRAPDGHAIALAVSQAREDGGVLAGLGVAPEDEAAWWSAADAWDTWRAGLYSRPGAEEGDPWIPARLEHRFAVAARTEGPGVVLEAPEYHGGRLDWYDFAWDPAGTLSPAAGDPARPRTIRRAVLPAQAAYPGMPVDRWWEFEDARTDFGGLEAEPGDLARLLVGAYATFYSNDWFLVPLELPVGTIARVHQLVVRNTFGEATRVKAARPDAGFRLFRLDRAAGGDVADVLLLAPATPGETEGAPVEEVRFFRDEMANLSWAVEHTVADRTGRPRDRWEAWTARRSRIPRPTAADQALVYRLQSEVPPHWFPLAPVPGDTPGDTRFRLLRRPVPGGPDAVPAGAVLADAADVRIHEEEIPREGLRIRRAWQMARGTDGRAHVWIGRRRTAGRGEGHSGLVFDSVGLDRDDDGPREPAAPVLAPAAPGAAETA